MADLATSTQPIIAMSTLAQIGNSGTVSFGIKNNNVSEREYSPPIPAVTIINPTDSIPKLECLASTTKSHFLLSKTPTARPTEVIERSILLASSGLVNPSPGEELIPVTMARGVAIKPPSSAQCATASLDSGPFFKKQRRKATPDKANIPTVSSVEIT